MLCGGGGDRDHYDLMRRGRRTSPWRSLVVTVVLLAATSVPAAQRAPDPADGGAVHGQLSLISGVIGYAFVVGPDQLNSVHRMFTRAEHVTDRLADTVEVVATVWAWILLSAACFLLVSAFASVADLRMLTLRHEARGALSRYIAYGLRTFFRILGDRHTPSSARLIIVAALLYWFVPLDVIPDTPVLPGFIDDVLVAAVAAKVFIYLCPEWLVAYHAAAVEGRHT